MSRGLLSSSRWGLRPPVVAGALEHTGDGRVLLRIRRPWSDGTRAIVFEPLALLARRSALTPRPRVNLLLYQGVFAPHARRRADAVAAAARVGLADSGAAGGEGATEPAAAPRRDEPERSPPCRGAPKPRWFAWPDLLRRVFEIDVLACTACGGRLRLLATIDPPDVVRQILAHLGLPTALPAPAPARSPPAHLELPFDPA